MEYLERVRKSHTFASAFEKQPRERQEKEFFEKIYINREVVQEARYVYISWVKETNRHNYMKGAFRLR